MFERKKTLTREQVALYKKVRESYSITIVLSYLGQRDSLRLQILNRFFYDVQIPRAIGAVIEIKLRKVRLHLFNHDYLILFNMQTWTKEKRMLRNENIPHIWNCQSIEVRG